MTASTVATVQDIRTVVLETGWLTVSELTIAAFQLFHVPSVYENVVQHPVKGHGGMAPSILM